MPAGPSSRPDAEPVTPPARPMSAPPAGTAHPDPGRTPTLRRLNRTEYQNAVRDLLALEVDAAALLPADEASHGFDNVTVGGLSPTGSAGRI